VAEADLEVVREIFAASNERNWARAMGHYAESATLIVTGGLTPGTYEGREALGEWFSDWLRQFERDYRFEELEARELGKVTRVGVFFSPHDPLDPAVLPEWSDPQTH
jgi:ketosteroid isomerase-like protein